MEASGEGGEKSIIGVSEVVSAVAEDSEIVGKESDGVRARALFCSWAARSEADADK